MDTVVLLFRLIVKVAAVGGVAPQPHPRLDPIQSGSVRGHAGHRPCAVNTLQYPIFVLEVLLSGILTVYASIALSYALRYYKNSRGSPKHRTHGKPTQSHHNILYTDTHTPQI